MASADNRRPCCLVSCKKEPISSTDGRVDVRGFGTTAEQRKGFHINWDDNGVATLHHECWRLMQRAAQGNSPDDSPVILHELERGMVQEAKKTAEFHNSVERIQYEASRVAKLLISSGYCIAFTGAGISTAAGIGDFRGIRGKWTNMDKSKKYGSKAAGAGRQYSLADLRPTYTHEALEKLLQMGILKYIISQNTDGLHRLSGIPGDKISELHGNAFMEKCEKCGMRYDRGMICRSRATNVPPNPCKRCKINHRTGRMCQKKGCGGYLMNTIINFGDYLEEDVLSSAQYNALRSDLVLCLGTTLMVSPANSLVEMGKDPVRLIICNRQVTPYDDVCLQMDSTGVTPLGSRVYGDCDRLMKEVMKEILPKEELIEWERDRETRMLAYDARRKMAI